MTAEAPISKFGERSARAPAQLDAFAFLVGQWRGAGSARAADGSSVRFEMTWIGRYVLDGTAIADEFHGATPDGKPYLGISLRQFDAAQSAWTIEYVNVTGSFIRRQVNARGGSVRREGDAVEVISVDGSNRIRETYRVHGRDRFDYSTALSRDAGRTWDPPMFELQLTRVE